MNQMEKDLRDKVKRAFSDKRIELFIGYGRRPLDGRIIPVFIRSAEDVEMLVWNPLCVEGLARYAMSAEGKVGMLLRGCDSRAVNVLLQESQLDRESLYLVGVSCQGVVDRRKVDAPVQEASWQGDNVVVDGKSFKRDEILAGQCLQCRYPAAMGTDELLGENLTGARDEVAFADVDKLESMGIAERSDFWDAHFARCLRCDACRNICPVCFCERCVLDQTLPNWVPRRTEMVDNRMYHAIRFMHVAGRCVDCGECERACPVCIPLRLLAKKLEKDVRQMFSFDVGVNAEDTPMLSQYKDDDKADFIR